METTTLNTRLIESMSKGELIQLIQKQHARNNEMRIDIARSGDLVEMQNEEIERLNKRCKQYEALYNAAVMRSPEQANKLALRLVNSVENAEV